MVKKTRKKIFKIWFPWEPEKLESWLSEKAEEGWIPEGVNWGMTVFYFRKGAPEKRSYGTDFHPNPSPAYRTRGRTAGWQLVGSSLGWFIWTKIFEGNQKPYFLSDKTARLQSHRRFMGAVMPLAAVQFAIFPLFINFLKNKGTIAIVVSIIFSILSAATIFAITKMTLKLKHLQKKEE